MSAANAVAANVGSPKPSAIRNIQCAGFLAMFFTPSKLNEQCFGSSMFRIIWPGEAWSGCFDRHRVQLR
jgi:hypothetical protein